MPLDQKKKPQTPQERSTKYQAAATETINPVLAEAENLERARVQNQQEDLNFLNAFADASTAANKETQERRAELLQGVDEDLRKLDAAQNMHPIIRDLMAIVGDITGSEVGNVDALAKRVKNKQTQLQLFDKAAASQQAGMKNALNLFKLKDEAIEGQFDAQQKSIDTRLRVASQFSSLATAELTNATAKLELGLKEREVSRVKRQDKMNEMALPALLDLREQAEASESGYVDAGGVQLSIADLEEEYAHRQTQRIDLETAEITAAAGRDEHAQTSYKRAVQSMTLSQLQNVAANNYQVRTETDAGPVTYDIPPAVVQEEMNRRIKQRNENAGVLDEMDERAATAVAELQILRRTSTGLANRVTAFYGEGSGAAQQIADTMTRGTAALQSSLGGITDTKQLDEMVASGAISPERAGNISRRAKKLNEQLESQVGELAKQTFPEDKEAAAVFSSYLRGVDVAAKPAMTALVKMSIGGLPRGITLDSPMGQTLQVVQDVTAEYIRRNVKDAPNLTSLSQTNIMALVVDRMTNRIKPDYEGLLSIVAEAARGKWTEMVTDSMLSASVEANGSPAFGNLSPQMINAALSNAQAIAKDKYPDDANLNERAAIEAAEFMKQLNAVVTPSGQTGSDVFAAHLRSDVFSNFIGKTSQQMRQSSYPAFLLDNGAIQGNFMSDINSLRELYLRQAGALEQEVMLRRSKLTELFSDPNERDIFAVRMAGYLAAGADPQQVDSYVDELVQRYGGDAQAIMDSINQNREEYASKETTRKKILANTGSASSVLEAILTGFAQTSGSYQARQAQQNAQGIGPQSEFESAASEQAGLSIFDNAPSASAVVQIRNAGGE